MKKHKNGNKALTNVPFSKEISPTQKLKKITSLLRTWWGPRQRPCAERGPSAQTCALPTAPAGSRQRPVNRLNPGQRLCQELRRGPLAQVASVPTASRRSRRHSGRQPKCDGTRSFSDGALRAEGWLSAKRWFCRGSRPADGPTVGKGFSAVSTSVPSTALGKEILCWGPDKKPLAKPEFPVVKVTRFEIYAKG
jgi:hypothetical protein